MEEWHGSGFEVGYLLEYPRQSKIGYHFCTTEALVGDRAVQDYLCFGFKGGAAGIERRVLRARLIADILERKGFHIRRVQDSVTARLSGSTGVPVLTGQGSLQGGHPMALSLQNALPGSVAHLIIGSSAAYLPFYGGTLVPAPQFFVFALPVAPDGALVLGANWPASNPSGLGYHFQYWINDPAGPQGLSASNGLLGVTP